MEQIILFLFLTLFPFGQIIRLGILQPIDVVVGLGAFLAIYKGYKKPSVFKYFDNFLLIAVFSWVFSALLFPQIELLYGLLYLVRLAAYFYFFVFVWHFANKSGHNRSLLLNALLVVATVSAIFGWIQFWVTPDIRSLFYWGWDEHLFRLVGTFLDPAFLGLILVFGTVIALFQKKYLISAFFALTLLFTYSRGSYLAFLAGIAIFAFLKGNFKKYLLVIVAFIVLVLLVPTKSNRILTFTRAFSALSRIENYQETLKIFKASPVFGIGYNNMCLARNRYIGIESFSSHACSGSDSSLLLILATTGVIGLSVFAQLLITLWRNSDSIFRISLIVLLVHSFFSNSVFYPWVMGWMAVLLAISLRRKIKS